MDPVHKRLLTLKYHIHVEMGVGCPLYKPEGARKTALLTSIRDNGPDGINIEEWLGWKMSTAIWIGFAAIFFLLGQLGATLGVLVLGAIVETKKMVNDEISR